MEIANKYDDEIELEKENKALLIEEEAISKIYYVNLDFEISNASYYRKLYTLLQKATKRDVIYLIINNNGGYVDTLIQICHYLLNTRARTIAEVHCAFSAAAFIALACDDIKIHPFSNIMLHPCSAADIGGNIEEATTSAVHERKRLKTLLDELCMGFLTKDEIEKVLNGKNYYFDYKDIKRRLKNRKISKLRSRK